MTTVSKDATKTVTDGAVEGTKSAERSIVAVSNDVKDTTTGISKDMNASAIVQQILLSK